MAVSYKKLFHLLIEKNMTNAQLQQEAGFSANIITRLKRNGKVKCLRHGAEATASLNWAMSQYE